jgi:hypothetical protein
MASGDEAAREIWVAPSIFVFTGLGFVVANLIGNKMRKQFKPDDV